jgi:hypothetical protein
MVLALLGLLVCLFPGMAGCTAKKLRRFMSITPVSLVGSDRAAEDRNCSESAEAANGKSNVAIEWKFSPYMEDFNGIVIHK